MIIVGMVAMGTNGPIFMNVQDFFPILNFFPTNPLEFPLLYKIWNGLILLYVFTKIFDSTKCETDSLTLGYESC
jgi:hypothetical protein